MFLVGFAIRTPTTSNLYKESLWSILLGTAVTVPYPIYSRQLWCDKVATIYDMMLRDIEINPKLAEVDSDTEIVKNFGQSRWANNEIEREEDIQYEDMISNRTGYKTGWQEMRESIDEKI